MSRLVRFITAVLMLAPLVLAGGARPASALTFNFSIYQSDTLTSAQAAAFDTAAAAWSAVLKDNITVDVQIGFRDLGSSVLGSTTPVFGSDLALNVFTALALDATSSDDSKAVASLPLPTGRVSLTTAQAKALGYTSSGLDGVIEFSSNSAFAFSTARNANGTIAAGTFDLVGIAEHEIGHLLGFDSSIDGGTGFKTLLDEFRYSGANTRSVTAGQAAYFSLDGAVNAGTPQFANGVTNQASHWLSGTGSLMDPTFAPGQVRNITALDLQALDVIGYDVQIPEPSSLALLAGMVAMVALKRRRTPVDPQPA